MHSHFKSIGASITATNIFIRLNILTFYDGRLRDLDQSCERASDGELINCQCNDAQRRVYNRQIDCGVEVCPDDCEVCKFCLYYVVDCNSHSPSMTPSVAPSQLSSIMPSMLPSTLLSASPSSHPSSSPSSPTTYQSSCPTGHLR